MSAIWLFLRAESRRRWRAWLSLALIVGVFTGGVVTAAAGARRTGSAYARFLDWGRAADALVGAEPYDPSFARLSPTAVMRVPQVANAAVIKQFNVTHRRHRRPASRKPGRRLHPAPAPTQRGLVGASFCRDQRSAGLTAC